MKGKITREELDKSLISDMDNISSQLDTIVNKDIIQYKGIADGITDETDSLQTVINSLGWNGGVV